MLVIRSEQMSSLGEGRFIEEMAKVLRSEFEDAANQSWHELKEAVRRQMLNAMRYGFGSEQEVAVYVTTAWLMGDEFDTENEEVENLLLSGNFQPHEKIQRLEEWVTGIFEEMEEE